MEIEPKSGRGLSRNDELPESHDAMEEIVDIKFRAAGLRGVLVDK